MNTTILERVTKAMNHLALIAAAARDGASREGEIVPEEVMEGIVFAAEEAHGELYWIRKNAGRPLGSPAPTDDDLAAGRQQKAAQVAR